LQQRVSKSCIFRLVTRLRRHKAGLHVMGRPGLMRGYSNFCSWARAPPPTPRKKAPTKWEPEGERNNQIVFSLGKCSLLGLQKSAVTVQSHLYAEPTYYLTWEWGVTSAVNMHKCREAIKSPIENGVKISNINIK
jgi:hypothetical protein